MSEQVVVIEEDDRADLEAVVATIQRAMLLYPAASQALFHTLVTEGRKYARTQEGGLRQDQLAGSELVVRCRVIWDSITSRALEDDPTTVIPTAVIEAFVKLAAQKRMEAELEEVLMNHLFRGGAP